jgi:hypothetical protein
VQLDATPTALCSQGLLRFGRQQGLHGSGQQVAVHRTIYYGTDGGLMF